MNKNTLNLRIDEVVCVGRAKKLLGGGGVNGFFRRRVIVPVKWDVAVMCFLRATMGITKSRRVVSASVPRDNPLCSVCRWETTACFSL